MKIFTRKLFNEHPVTQDDLHGTISCLCYKPVAHCGLGIADDYYYGDTISIPAKQDLDLFAQLCRNLFDIIEVHLKLSRQIDEKRTNIDWKPIKQIFFELLSSYFI